MSKTELEFIKGLLEALRLKCKTDALYHNTVRGIELINKELESCSK